MKRFFSKPLNTFLTLFILLFLTFLLFPINIFDGEIIYNQGLVTMAEKRPLSLYFVSGLEYSKDELKGVKEFHLLPKGYLMAFLFIIGIPALTAYRVNLGYKQRNVSSDNMSQIRIISWIVTVVFVTNFFINLYNAYNINTSYGRLIYSIPYLIGMFFGNAIIPFIFWVITYFVEKKNKKL